MVTVTAVTDYNGDGMNGFKEMAFSTDYIQQPADGLYMALQIHDQLFITADGKNILHFPHSSK